MGVWACVHYGVPNKGRLGSGVPAQGGGGTNIGDAATTDLPLFTGIITDAIRAKHSTVALANMGIHLSECHALLLPPLAALHLQTMHVPPQM